ncbi:MAG: tetratricopeptide repeat protein [Betaproteobacteria bacterium]|nr:MAG: tetratricopeptide repeat protein [Betaproteobacteria bacterium]
MLFKCSLPRPEPLFKRALKFWVNTLGSKHPDVATALGNLAQLQRKTHQDKETESLEEHVAEIR